MLWCPTRYPRLSPVCICKADSDEPEIRKITEKCELVPNRAGIDVARPLTKVTDRRKCLEARRVAIRPITTPCSEKPRKNCLSRNCPSWIRKAGQETQRVWPC